VDECKPLPIVCPEYPAEAAVGEGAADCLPVVYPPAAAAAGDDDDDAAADCLPVTTPPPAAAAAGAGAPTAADAASVAADSRGFRCFFFPAV
jgi:hypothetical protein